MLEFIGVAALIAICYLIFTADELDFKFKIDNKTIVDYHKHTEEDEGEEEDSEE